MAPDAVLDYLKTRQDRHVEQLCEWLRIPSISSVQAHAPDVRRAAMFVHDELKALGLETELIETDGHPLVYAQTEQRPERRTLLFYGHYDVQPVDPLDLWHSPPFEPAIRDGIIYARGGSDDKGQLYTHVKALEAYLKTGTELPVNVKFIIEGEEECGGPAIYRYVEANPGKLACDAVVISDTSLYDADTPAICYSLKGLAYMQIDVKGPGADLHSGSFGGTVQNPGNAICEIVAKLKDADGVVRIPGFYDDVLPVDADEKAAFASLDYTDEVLRRDTGAPGPFGEKGYTTLERMWARPTCDVNGLWSGYSGEGAKTIVPSVAGAKVSMRLVPNQNPKTIARLFTEYVQSIAPQGVEVTVTDHHGANPVMVPRDSAMMEAGMRAMEHGFGKRPVFIREGGSIPIVGTFQASLKSPVLLLGYGLPNDNIHSPNEKFHIENFVNGIRTTAHLLQEAAR
ncbi:MAG TPA: dipeptidase [Candidatus Krumholzibacteria bacterium]|nr:dipeptidase [Candidatus Krumholzibacteria bacterium]HRX50123.1 dipeptidase [Candidatus Krumholzibacteria bacterium]